MNLLDEKGSLEGGDASPGERFARVSERRPRALPAAVAVSVLVGILLSGGALYAARVSESAPQVVYSASLEEVEDEAQGSLKININTADVDDLDELPQVGPATTETIIEYRRTNGMFRSVDEFASMRNCKSVDLTFRALLTGSVARVTVARSRVSIGSRTPLTP